MAQMENKLKNLTLRQVAYPGTHDSGTFGITENSDFSPDAPDFVKKIQNIPFIGQEVKKIVSGWARAQGNDWATQLNDGIRYLDIRTCLNTSDNKLYIVHGMYGGLVDDMISAVAQFITANPKEIILLDFNHFYAMTNTAHQSLVNKLISTFGSKIIPSSVGVTGKVSDVWNNGQQVIIFYDDSTMVSSHPELWPESTISSPWPNVTTVDDLKTKLDAEVANIPQNQFFVLQGILTEDGKIIAEGFIPGFPSTLEEYEKDTSPAVLGWIQSDWSSVGLNIVILDWYQNTPNYLDVMKSII